MTSKHTNGPWIHVAVDGGWDGVAEAANPQSLICVLKHNNPANADLIAAAPELLNALEYAQAWITEVGDRKGIPNGGTLQTIEAAIAKATGGAA